MLSRSTCSDSDNSAPARSIISRRWLLGNVEARFFFEPDHLSAEASDLGVEFFELLLMSRLVDSGFAFSLKESGQPAKSGGFPGADLVGMNVVLRSDLGEGFLLFERLGDDFGFESRGMTFSHGILSLTYFCR